MADVVLLQALFPYDFSDHQICGRALIDVKYPSEERRPNRTYGESDVRAASKYHDLAADEHGQALHVVPVQDLRTKESIQSATFRQKMNSPTQRVLAGATSKGQKHNLRKSPQPPHLRTETS
ncbi:hypothetical protein MRX96_006352 [Rhipicephalus microplus]